MAAFLIHKATYVCVISEIMRQKDCAVLKNICCSSAWINRLRFLCNV